jgi:hypothetical protein
MSTRLPHFVLPTLAIACAALLPLAGCASTKGGKATVAGKATESQTNALLGQVKSLEGEWIVTGPDGKPGVIVFKTSSAGSVVREIMFPGQDHEMTNVYHMDGPTCVVTHFCAAGNQPRMRATKAEGNAIAFNFDSVSNLSTADEQYMGGLTLTFVDKNHVKQTWKHYASGKVDNEFSFDLVRKQ